ncbi:MAG TPA: GDSL-type esterase/lipase family protein [Anaerovoracaceae bacterium]|nr:GDSL-type esterase/lipase family protein [Anaerovoracaceae bacterium]
MKIVCIGNSIVNGFPHRRSQCFVSLWRQASGHEIINKGENGDVTSNIFARFEKDVISHKPDAVVILTGTNDFIYQVCSPEEALGYMDKMAVLAGKNSIGIIMMTPLLIDAPMAEKFWIPDIDYGSVNEKLKAFRRLMLDYGNKNGVRIIDAQEQFLQLYSEENVSDYLLDGLHPTVLGHEAIAGFLID